MSQSTQDTSSKRLFSYWRIFSEIRYKAGVTRTCLSVRLMRHSRCAADIWQTVGLLARFSIDLAQIMRNIEDMSNNYNVH